MSSIKTDSFDLEGNGSVLTQAKKKSNNFDASVASDAN